ncbi:MAG: hypothetical protein LBM27_00475 [Lactobacillaceae bacterium]|jgi:hypothetical protein|nr:hypothetical protein [Lactobacillaceae bacterium]
MKKVVYALAVVVMLAINAIGNLILHQITSPFLKIVVIILTVVFQVVVVGWIFRKWYYDGQD